MPFNRGFPDRKAHTCRRTLNQPCGFGMLGVIEIGLFAQGGNDGQQGFSLPVTQRFVDDWPVRKLLSPNIETVSFDLQKAARDKFENIVLKRLSITASELDQIFSTALRMAACLASRQWDVLKPLSSHQYEMTMSMGR